jgi:hypothetical protein
MGAAWGVGGNFAALGRGSGMGPPLPAVASVVASDGGADAGTGRIIAAGPAFSGGAGIGMVPV